MVKYKLVTQDYKTRKGCYNETDWRIGERVEADCSLPLELCTGGVVHVYDDPLIAVLMNPIHANIQNPRMVEVEVEGECVTDGTKCGYRAATMVREIGVPKMTHTQRKAASILCAKQVRHDSKWNEWADRWLSGRDRSLESAISACGAVRSASYASYASYASVTASAWSVTYAVYDCASIDLRVIVKEAMKY